MGPRYDIYYVRQFPISDLDRYHRAPEKELKKFIETLTKHIQQFGLENPIGVHIKDGISVCRPGKCRVSAYRTLGRDTIPAIVFDYDKRGPYPGWEPLPHDATFIQKKLLKGDQVIELDRRYGSLKKNVDVVHRPGVINRYEREVARRTRTDCNPVFDGSSSSRISKAL